MTYGKLNSYVKSVIRRRKPDTFASMVKSVAILTMVAFLTVSLQGSAALAASISRELPLSARLTSTTSGLPVPDGNFTVTFRFYTNETGGTAVWTETQTIRVANGVLFARLGSVTPLPETLNFSGSDYYLGIQVSGEEEMSPRRKIGAVPTAINSDTVDGFHASQTPGANQIPVTDANGSIMLSGGLTVGSHILPSTNGTINLGSSSAKFGTIYADTISAASTTISGTNSTAFTINTEQATNNTDDAQVKFYLGPVLNDHSALQWSGTNNRFELYSRLSSHTLADLRVNSLSTASNISSDGTLAVTGATTLSSTLSVTGNANFDSGTLFIDTASDRVGIGTISPEAKLHVVTGGSSVSILLAHDATDATRKLSSVASMHYTNAEEPVGLIFADVTSTANQVNIGGGRSTLNAATQIGFFTGATTTTVTGSERARIASDGNFGIGDLSPAALLTVGTNDAFQVTSAGNVSTAGTLTVTGATTLSSTLGVTGATTLSSTLGVSGATTLSSTLNVSGNTTIGSSSFFVNTSTGRVGIGTTSPQQLLEVSSASDARILVRSTTEAVAGTTTLQFMTGSGAPSSANSTAWIQSIITQADPSALKGNLVFSTNRGDSLTEAMRIDDAGNVGIGATTIGRTPLDANSRILTVQTGTANRPGVIELIGNAGANVGSGNPVGALRFGGLVTGGTYSSLADIRASRTASGENYGQLFFQTANNGTLANRMTIDESGNVGIGDTSPAALLTVGSGDLFQVNSSGNVSTAGTLAVTGAASLASTLAVTGNTTLSGTLSAAATSVTTLSVSDAATLSSTLAVTGAATFSSTLTVNNTTTLNGYLTVNGNGTASDTDITLGDSSEDQIVINASIAQALIPTGSGTINLGSATNRFGTIYADTINYTSSESLSTISNSLTINSDATVDEDSWLEFYRGSSLTSAKLYWDAANDQFNVNYGFLVQGNTMLGNEATDTTTVRGAVTMYDSSSTYKMLFGNATQPGLYRSAANTLAVDGNFQLDASGTSDGTNTTYDSRSLTFNGNYWNGTASTDVTGGILLDVTGTTPKYGLALQTGGTTRAYFDQAGRLGLGTADPQARLHIEGSGNTDIYVMAGASNTARTLVGETTTTGQWGGLRWLGASDSLDLVHSGYSVTDAALSINSSGMVSAAAALSVGGATTLASTLEVTGATTLSSTLGVTGATTLSNTLGVTGATTLSSTLSVTGVTSLADALTIARSTASGSTTEFITLNNTSTGTASQTRILFQGGSTGTANMGAISLEPGSGYSQPRMRFQTGVTLTDRMVIGHDGAVGFGDDPSSTYIYTFNPNSYETNGSILNVSSRIGGSLSGTTAQLLRNANSIFEAAYFDQGTTLANRAINAQGTVYIKGKSATSSYAALDVVNSSDTSLLYVRNDGNVGIGATTLSYKLEVLGTGNDTASGSIRVRNTTAGTSAAAIINTASDTASGYIGSFSGSHGTGALQDRFVVAINSDASGMVFYAPGATQDIRMYTGGTSERVRIDTTGYVGIGDTSPAALLTVGSGDLFQVNSSGNVSTAGTLAVTGATTLASTLGVTGAATLSSTLAVTGAATFSSTVSAGSTTLDSLTVTNNASVGGTLGVTGATTLSSTLVVTDAATLSSSLSVGTTLAVTGATTLSSTLAVTGAATLSSTLAVTGNATFSANVGIGGAATTDPLTLYAPSGDNGFVLKVNDPISGTHGGIDFYKDAGGSELYLAANVSYQQSVGNTVINSADPASYIALNSRTTGDIAFYTANVAGSLINTMRIVGGTSTYAGSVVIGESSSISLANAAAWGKVLQIQDGSHVALSLRDTGTSDQFDLAVDNGSFRIYDAGKTAYRMWIDTDGNVGMGTNSPTALLHLAGSRSSTSWTTSGVQLQVAAATLTATTGSGTIARRVANSFGIPTFASNSATTITDAATVYIAGAPAEGANTIITNPYALEVNGNILLTSSAGTTIRTTRQINVASQAEMTFTTDVDTGDGTQRVFTFVGGVATYMTLDRGNLAIGTTTPSARLHVQSIGFSAASWLTNGVGLRFDAASFNNTSGGTAATAVVHSFGQPTLTASSATTTTHASNLYVAGAPAAGSNQTLTSSSALRVASASVTSATNAYGLFVEAPTGATTNYAAMLKGTTVASNSTVSWTMNGVTEGTTVFTSETGVKAPAFMAVGGFNSSFAIKTDPLGGFGTMGLLGAAGNGSGSRANIGVYGYGVQQAIANSSSKVAGGTFISELSASANYTGTAYGVYASTSMTAAVNASLQGVGYGVYGTATGATNTTVYGGYFTATGGTVNYDLMVDNATGGNLTLRRNDGTATAGEVIGVLSFENNDAQLTTQRLYGKIEMQAAQAITTDAAAGNMLFYTTGTSAGGSPTERMRIRHDGNVGIGATNPGSLLTLNGATGTVTGISLGSNTDGITTSRYIGITNSTDHTNLATNQGFSGIEFGGPSSTDEGFIALHTHDYGTASGERLRIDKSGKVGIGVSTPSVRTQITGGALCVGSAVNCTGQADDEGKIYSQSQVTIGADLAENYPTKDKSLVATEIVELDPNNEVYVRRATGTNNQLLGIVAENPGVLLGGFGGQYKNERQVAVALSGRVRVKIDPASPAVAVGDPLTASSSKPGYATKATGNGTIIGRAMEAWIPGMNKQQLMVFAGTQQYTVTAMNVAEELQTKKVVTDLIQSPEGKNLAINTQQLVVNGKLVVNEMVTITKTLATPASATQTLTASGKIKADATKVKVVGDGGAVTLTSINQIADGEDGQLLIVQGVDDGNTVTVKDQSAVAGSNLELGAGSRTLGKGDILTLTFDAADGVWYEVSFTDN